MADITNEIQKIGQAVYGEEVRGAIMDALEAMNTETIAAEEWATGGTGGTPGPDNNAKYYADAAEAAQAAVAGLPAGYIRQKYLQSDGAVSINAGLTLNQSSRVVCRYAATEYMEVGDRTAYLFGIRYSASSRVFAFGQYAPTEAAPSTRWIPAYNTGSGVVPADVHPFDLAWHTVDFNANKVWIDGRLVKEFDVPSADFTTPSNMRLFALYASANSGDYYYGKFKMAECWVYQDGTNLSRHFIPARRTSDDVLGMYDIVGGQFYEKRSQDTGELTSGGDMTVAEVYELTSENAAGLATVQADTVENSTAIDAYIAPLPSAYKKLDYLESSSTQFVDLAPFKANQDTRFVCKYQFTGVHADSDYVFGGRYNGSTRAYGFYLGTNNKISVNYIDQYYSMGDGDQLIHVLDLNKNEFYLDGVLKNSAEAATFEADRSIYLFGVHAAPSSQKLGTCRIYAVQVYNDGTLILDLIPCVRISDGATGMYDAVSGAFYASSGELIEGNAVTLDGLSEKTDAVYNEARRAADAAEENADAIAELQSSIGTKDYVKTEADRVADAVRQVQTGRTLTFAAISDMHYLVEDPEAGTVQAALDDMKQAVKAIAGQVHVDCFVSFGDTIYRLANSAYGDYAKGKKESIASTKILSDCFGNNPQLRLVGNHDPNSEQSGVIGYTADQLNAFYGIYNTMLTRDENSPNGGYGYVDIDRQRIRLIVLNTSWYAQNPGTYQTQYSFGDTQAAFLAGALDLTAKNDAADWKIIVLSHIQIDLTSKTAIAKYANIFSAYEDGSSCTIGSSTYDFAGKNAAPVVLYLNGHTHKFNIRNIGRVDAAGSAILSNLQIANFVIPNALPGRESASIDGVIYTKTPGTAESTTFIMLTLDTDNGVLYAHHYGAGFDTVYHYEPTEAATGTILETSIENAEWASVDDTVATVSGGTITAAAAGNVTVYARETETVDETTVTKRIEAWNLSVTA